MIKNKNNIIKLLDEIKNLTYSTEAPEINADTSEETDFSDYKDGISMLYKNRKD